jgi:hypothetical protein
MKATLLLICALLGVAAAATKSYTIVLYDPATIGAAELKPGSYKIEVAGDKAIIHDGKATTEVPVRTETAPGSKYNVTTMKLDLANGKHRVEEIHLGGTNTKLILTESSTSSAAQQ